MYVIALIVILIYGFLFARSCNRQISEKFSVVRKGLFGIFDRISITVVYYVEIIKASVENKISERKLHEEKLCKERSCKEKLGKERLREKKACKSDLFGKNLSGKKIFGKNLFWEKIFGKKSFENRMQLGCNGSQTNIYLESLNPGENIKKIRETYIIQKLSLSLMLIFVGTLAGVGMKYSSQTKSEKITDLGEIARSDYNGGTKTVTIQAASGTDKETIDVEVSPRQLSEGEVEEILPEFYMELEEALLGENANADNISSDLNPVSKISGYPFAIAWSSSDYGLVYPMSGKVSEVDEPCQVTMTATVKYLNYTFENKYELTIVPEEISDSERYAKNLENLIISSEEESRGELLWQLPDEFNGDELTWKTVVKDNSVVIWVGIFAVAIAIFFISDFDLGKKVNEKKSKMKWEYAEIVRKLALFIGAGMTVRNAFGKIAADALNAKNINPVYEEMMYTCRELRSGVPEEEAYERFGRRTGVQEYIRIGTLLQQNLKKGSGNLTLRLCEEAENATVERLQNCRKNGEEAGTKLLVPMVLLLLVVMVMIMFPAFSSMQL